MDVYTSAFTYPPPAYGGPPIDAMLAICYQAMQSHAVTVNCSSSDHDATNYNFLISGAYSQVLAAKALILRECPLQTRSSIQVPRSEILDFHPDSSAPALKHQVRRVLDEIASNTLAHIAVVNPSTPSHSLPPPPDALYPSSFPSFHPAHLSSTQQTNVSSTLTHSAHSSSSSILETEPLCQLVITGTPQTVQIAQVRLLVTLDELSGLHSEAIEVDYKLHPVIAGRKRATIQSIQEETATNVYLPSPLRGLVGGGSTSGFANGVSVNGPNGSKSANTIYITGEYFGVQRAKDMIFQLAHSKSKSVLSRPTAPVLPAKLDWMLTHHLDDLQTIASDNACFLDFPPLGGTQTGLVRVYGESRLGISRAVRAVMALAAQFLTSQFYLLPPHFNLLLPVSALTLNLNSSQISPTLQRLSALIGGAEVVFRDNCFEIFGDESEVRRGIMAVGDLQLVRPFHHEIRFQIELANEHRDFISGKKNGKINKIMQLTGCKIKFEVFSSSNGLPIPGMNPPASDVHNWSASGETPGIGSLYPPYATGTGPPGTSIPPSPTHSATPTPSTPTLPPPSSLPTNFVISLSGNTLQQSLHGLNALLEELPAEISFYVPESYHKRIIGVGGRSIQRIMKRWGVFVKFFGNAESSGTTAGQGDGDSPTGTGFASTGTGINTGPTANEANGFGDAGGSPSPSGYGGIGEDNVIARTPAKNAMNLENLKMAVLELVNPKDKDFTTQSVVIPRRYHRTLLGEKNIFIKDIETKTGSKVRFPDKETASDIVTIYGPESQVHIAAARLLDHVPFEADMNVPPHPDLARVVSSPEFSQFTERVKRDYQVVIVPRGISGIASNTNTPSSRSLATSTSRTSLRQSTGSTVGNGGGSSSPGDDVQAKPSLATTGSRIPTASPVGTTSSSPSFKFLCQRSNQDYLASAREALETFLKSRNVLVGNAGAAPAPPTVGIPSGFPGGLSGYASNNAPAAGTAVPTPGLGNGVVNTGGHPPGVGMGMGVGLAPGRVHKRADSFADAFPHFNSRILPNPNTGEPESFVTRRLRLATSTPDVKALFNSPSTYVYNLPEHDELDDAGFEAPEAPPVRAQGSDMPWNPPRIRHAPSVSFINIRNSDEAAKRGSDSLLDSKLNKDNKSRSLTTRAQSLDLTSLSRAAANNNSVVRTGSPTDSTNPPSPTSASALTPNFPNVSGAGVRSHSTMPFPSVGGGGLSTTMSNTNTNLHTHSHTHSHTGIAPYASSNNNGNHFQHHQHHHSFSHHHHSYPNTSSFGNGHFTNQFSTSTSQYRPRTQLSLSSSSSSLSSAWDQPSAFGNEDSVGDQIVNDPNAAGDGSIDGSVMDDVSRVISQMRLNTLG